MSAAGAVTDAPPPTLNPANAPGHARDGANDRPGPVAPAAADASSPLAMPLTSRPDLQAAAPASSGIHPAIDTPGFAQALSDKVAFMIDKDVGSAKLSINPPQLGPIEVHVEVSGDKAQIVLSTHSLITRDALEAATPRLREVLGANGFTQVSVDVSHRSFQERSMPRQQWNTSTQQRLQGPVADEAVRARSLPGTLDAYA